MTDRRVVSPTGRAVDETRTAAFASSLRGALLRPRDESYDMARRVWNAMIDRHPALIARCADVNDVIAAVRFARDNQLLVAVRGGGHNVAGNAVCDGGLVIDLSRMRAVQVDAGQRSATAQGGATWAELDRATQAHGLGMTGGEVSSTGIAGLTLGGGFGWLMGKLGLTCDSLTAVEIVTADAQRLRASATEHPDLFWGVRGGGGNFGIVTTFEYAVHPVGPVLAGMVIYPLSRAKEFLRRYRECTATAPDELTAMGALLVTGEGVPAVGAIVVYCGDIMEGERIVQPFRALGAALADTIQPMSYVALQSMLDATAPSGRLNYWKASYVRVLTDEAIDVLVAQAAVIPSPFSSVLIEHLHGAACRVAPSATAFGVRDEHYSLGVFSVWTDPAESDRHVQWARGVAAAMERFASGGVYVNYLGEEGAPRVRAAYGANYERLAALKRLYDPTNFFRMNQNIVP